MPARQATGFLNALDEVDRAALGELGHVRRFAKGRMLFLEGDRSDDVILLREGQVKIVSAGWEGGENLLAIRGPGDLIGELTAIDDSNHPRIATAVAMCSVRAQVLPASDFLHFVASRPGVALSLLRALSKRMRDSDRRRVEYGSYDAAHRLARVLLELAGEHGRAVTGGTNIGLPLSQDELAGLIGASRESVARALGTLRARGHVVTARRSIVIVDLVQLQRYAP
jgi:CRP-like cAMP-binding protein